MSDKPSITLRDLRKELRALARQFHGPAVVRHGCPLCGGHFHWGRQDGIELAIKWIVTSREKAARAERRGNR